MQIRYAFSELGSGLRRNLTMTIAVIVTVWVSLVLFGAGLLLSAEVELAKRHWYDKMQVAVYMCNKYDAEQGAARCKAGPVTKNQRHEIQRTLDNNPNVAAVHYESQKKNFDRLREVYKDNATTPHVQAEHMQQTFRVALKKPTQYQSVYSEVAGLQGVQSVQDSREVLDPLFRGLNALQWGAIGLAGGLLIAAVLQIGNTIRLTVFSRRREIGIMRLVGASKFYIQLPFVVEAVTAALVGAGLACASIAFTPWVTSKLRRDMGSVPWIDWEHTLPVMPILVLVGVLLAIVASLVTLRKYLEI